MPRPTLLRPLIALTTVLSFAGPAGAQSQVGVAPLSGFETISLGPGVSVQQVRPACFRLPCPITWQPTGLEFGAQLPFLLRANTFALGPAGRIFAAVDQQLLYTDDRGQHWLRARWEASASPNAMAFDGLFGAAVSDSGVVATTEDGGLTWRGRRDSAGQRIVAVAVLAPSTLVWADANGGLFASLDGGFTPRTLVEPARISPHLIPRATTYGTVQGPLPTVSVPTLRVERGAIWAPNPSGGWFRVDPRDGVMTVRAEGR